MKNYESPIIVGIDEIAEGIYMASGSDCYTVVTHIHQTPQLGRGDYRIQVDARHTADDNHHSGEQILTLTFNLPVVYQGSNGIYVGGSGTNIIEIKYNYHNNGLDNIGLGDVIVQSDTGLSVTNAQLSCNHNCGQHI